MEIENENRQKNKSFIVIIVILSLVIITMASYIVIGKVFSKDNKENQSKPTEITDEKDKDTDNKSNNSNSENNNQIKQLDLARCLNRNGNTYYNALTANRSKYGLSMNINSDKKTITLSIDWGTFGSIASTVLIGGSHGSEVETYQITGFTKNIQNVYIGDFGQSSQGITLLYLMEDGTVEYTSMFIKQTDSQGQIYYVINYHYDNNVIQFKTMGTINNINGVIEIYTADVSSSDGAGWMTTIGATKEGSFYDLGIINK